jgi:hypothetical protein
MPPHRRLPKAAFAAAVLACVLAAGARAEGEHAVPKVDRPEKTVVSAEDLSLYPPGTGGATFSFLPKGEPISFDRVLTLSAAAGERRVYLLRTKDGPGQEVRLVSYIVDKRRPRAPSAEPSGGLFYESVSPELKGEEGSVIMWAVLGADGSHDDFSTYTQESRPKIVPPSKGSVTRTLLAYAVSPSGLRSYPARFVYRLAEPGLPAAPPRVDQAALTADPAVLAPRVELFRGYAELSVQLPAGSSLITDFAAGTRPRSLDDFEIAESDGSAARLRIPCPYGWSGEVSLLYGTLKDGVAVYSPKPLVVNLDYPPEESSAPAAPPAPILSADPVGGGGFLTFPAYEGSVYVSIGEAESQLYAAPIPLRPGQSEVRLSWYGEDSKGRRSAKQSGSFSLPESLPDVDLTGASEGDAISGDVVLKPDARSAALLEAIKSKASLRYEFRIDGSFPPEPGPASPLFGDSLAIACPIGEERSIVLRYRVVSDRLSSEGRILRFTLDRKPPEAPQASETTLRYSDRPLSIALTPGTGAKTVLASVSVDGETAAFGPVKAPLELPGSDSGPITYRIRAYDLDAAGNRSKEMEALSIVVDTTSVYVASDGDDKGDGTPSKPFRSLDAAIAAAVRGGKKNVNIRGSLELKGRVQSSGILSLVGGFGPSWTKDGSIRAYVRIAVPQGQGAFSQKGGALDLRRVELRADSTGSGALIELADAFLSVSDSTLEAGSDGDIVLVSAARSRIELNGSQVIASRAMSFTAFSADSSEISLVGSSIMAAKGVRVFGAFDVDGGGVSIQESLLESSSDLGLSLLSLRSASLAMDRSVVSAEGGSGFLRLGVFKAVSGEVKNSKVLLDWSGPGTLFEISDGGPSFRHDTMRAASAKGGLRFFDLRGKPIQVWNSILDCSGPGGELLHADSAPAGGCLVADCVWGFDALVAGALDMDDLKSLNGLNASSPLYSSKPLISEAPERSFGAPLKSQTPLRRESACVGAALSLGSGYEVDFNGRPRPSPGKAAPDIGADELAD